MDELSIIIPVRGSSPALRRCLEALEALTPPPLEILVVNEGADPLVREGCRRFPVRHLEIELSREPVASRNFGAVHAGGELLLFLDPETLLPGDAVAHVEEAFEDNPHLSALVGSYDASPAEPGFLSQFENLCLHFADQNCARRTDRFWTGFGVIRREVFFVLGGFDRVPNEGLELGRRLSHRGFEIELRPTLRAQSLKRWTFFQMGQTRVFQRAIPAAELLWRYPARASELPKPSREWLSRAVAFALLPLLVVGFQRTGLHWLALSLMPLWTALNWPLFSFFLRRRGPRFLALAAVLHWFLSVLETASFLAGCLRACTPRRPARETFLHEVAA